MNVYMQLIVRQRAHRLLRPHLLMFVLPPFHPWFCCTLLRADTAPQRQESCHPHPAAAYDHNGF